MINYATCLGFVYIGLGITSGIGWSFALSHGIAERNTVYIGVSVLCFVLTFIFAWLTVATLEKQTRNG